MYATPNEPLPSSHPLVFYSLLGVGHDLLHILDGHDLVHLLQTLVTRFKALHNFHLNLCELDGVHHLLEVLQLLVCLLQ